MHPVDLRCEYLVRPLGIDVPVPRFSWKGESARRGARQTAYRLMVASSSALLDAGAPHIWDSGPVTSSRSTQVTYGGARLGPSRRYFWKVEVGSSGGATRTSEITWFETGLMGSPWEAEWITHPRQVDADDNRACPYLRRSFTLDAVPDEARVYVTALGLYRLFINGSRIGEGHLAPGWTDYRKRIPYQTFDVTDRLRAGANVIGLVLADGWYCGYLGTARQRCLYGDMPQGLLRLVDSSAGRVLLVSDASWEASFGPHVASDLYLGEVYDASLSLGPWSEPSQSRGSWEQVTIAEGSSGDLIASPIAPVAAEEELVPAEMIPVDDDTTIFDFGQNLAGWTRVTADGTAAGQPLVVRHAEVLQDGVLYTENLRHASATDRYTSDGIQQTFEPWFTYHGFRYAEVHHAGIPSRGINVTSVAARTPLALTGRFTCSSEDLNRLHEAIVRSYRSNWLEVPTDCPNRDERLGWSGDATICANTACYLVDAASFYTKWLDDLDDARTEEGLFTDVAPAVPPWITRGAPGWGEAGIIVPFMLHRFYGDRRILEHHLPAMKRWVDAIWAANLDLLWTRDVGSNYGDWLEVGTYTIKEVVSTCMFARSARMLAETFSELGDASGAKTYHDAADAIGTEFRRSYIRDGVIAGDTQSSYVLALACGVLDDETSELAAARLVDLIALNGGRLTTGFLATEHLLPVLADHGHLDVAYSLLEAHHFPSWLYFIDNGATTLWEHWDSWTPEHGFKNPFMNSFNHCSLGSVARFLYEYVGGIRPTSPGFATFDIHPQAGGSLKSARVEYDSQAGTIVSSWRRDPHTLWLDVVVPPNTEARVVVPKGEVRESEAPAEQAEGLLSSGGSGEQAFLVVGSGAYSFEVRL